MRINNSPNSRVRVSLSLSPEVGRKLTKMAIRKAFSETKGMKVKPMLSLSPLKNSAKRGIHNYSENYLQTSSVQPLYHVCFARIIFSYLVALPNEHRHLEHQLRAKDHGNGGGRSLITSRSFICNTGFLL